MSWKESHKSEKLDYQLLAVHVHYPSDLRIRAMLGAGFPDLIQQIGLEASRRFSRKSVELTEYVWGTNYSNIQERPAVLKGLAKPVPSLKGYFGGRDVSFRNERVVLAGLYFGSCHGNAFDCLLEQDVAEIHIPLDCTDFCLGEEDVTEHIMFGRYLAELEKHTLPPRNRDYRLFLPGQKVPHLKHLDGNPPFIVAFHRGWGEMMEFFEGGRRKGLDERLS